MKQLFLLLAFVFFLAACKKDDPVQEPKACFTTNKRLYGAGETVQFNNCSQNYDRVLWEFGNGQTAESFNPTFSWQNKGAHVVWLTVWKGELSSRAGSQVSVADSTYMGFRALFSGWQGSYRDSVLKFRVYTRVGGQVIQQFETERKGSELRDTLETGIRVNSIDDSFVIHLVIRSKAGLADSLQTIPFNVTDALSNIPYTRNNFQFVSVDHTFTMFYK